MNDPIIFTDQAAAKVWELIQEEHNFKLKLRAYVTGGGCSGFQYGFTFDEIANQDDIVISKTIIAESNSDDEIVNQDDRGISESIIIESDNEIDENSNPVVQLLVDPLSFQYLVGAEIDYKKDIEGEQFIIRNPNAKTTCGCGSSFSAE